MFSNLRRSLITLTFISLFITTGCASVSEKPTSSKEIATSGPTVLNARSTPDLIELGSNLKATRPAAIVADVKDFKSPVKEVKLKFKTVPVEVPLVNVSGTTWKARLSDRQLRDLAVNGKTMTYDAEIIAKNEVGQTAKSPQPLQIKIKAPEVT